MATQKEILIKISGKLDNIYKMLYLVLAGLIGVNFIDKLPIG